MEVIETLATPFPAATLRELVADLTNYPDWLDIVVKVEHGGTDAWLVDLRGSVGPLARSKRLRMARTVDEMNHVRFERAEIDGRVHAPWTLDAFIEATGDDTSEITMRLRYGGRLWVPVMERMLRDEIARSRAHLIARLEQGHSS